MRHFTIISTILIIFISFFALEAYAEIINVPDDFETIQEAIDESEDGDTVLVQPGRYVENIGLFERAITVASLILTTGDEAYIDSTIIDGDENGSVIRFGRVDENMVLTGFTITGGSGSQGEGHTHGGGICCYVSASPTLSYLRIIQNSADGGGGIYCFSFSSPVLTHLKVMQNSAGYGGGIMIEQRSSPIISHTSISHNSAMSEGGGIYAIYSSSLILRFTSIVENEARGGGGGLYGTQSYQCQFTNLTIAGNRSSEWNRYGAMFLNFLGDQSVNIINSIVWDNGQNPILLQVRDTLSICCYSDIEGGQDGCEIEGPLIWGEGNIDEDPLFVNPEEGDFHITVNSPCIDTGDPESPLDPDSTRADMGAYPFSQGSAVEGFVLDASNDEPLENAVITTTFDCNVIADSSGFWRIAPVPEAEFDITASIPNYLDSVLTDQFVDFNDTLEITFRLLHSEILLSLNEIEAQIDQEDTTQVNFTIRNNGNGPLQWTSETRLDSAFDCAPGEMRFSRQIGATLEDAHLKGVAFIDSLYYISGNNRWGGVDAPNMIYLLSNAGELRHEFEQPEPDQREGMTDLAWDARRGILWGAVGSRIYGLDRQGNVVSNWQTGLYEIRALAWDPDRELLWISEFVSDIIGFNRNGNAVDTLDRNGLRICGMAYWSTDRDEHPLYILDNPLGADRPCVHKFNPETNDTMFVTRLQLLEDGATGGIFMVERYDLYSTVLLEMTNDGPNDRIDIWQMYGDIDWMRNEPSAGVVNPGELQEIALTLDAADLEAEMYEGRLIFHHNAAGGRVTIPVSLTVNPMDIKDNPEETIPADFRIITAYPNPFNSLTTIVYSLPTESFLSLEVFSLSGRRIASLVDDFKRPGIHRISFNSDGISSGIYFIRGEASGQIQSRKLVLIR